MLARTTTLIHPSGERLETPLLVPSFSSKGFGTDASGASEVRRILSIAEEYLTESMLVSAYDIYHDHVGLPMSALTNIVLVDSGGYETSDLHDLSRPTINPSLRGSGTRISCALFSTLGLPLRQRCLCRWTTLTLRYRSLTRLSGRAKWRPGN